MIYRFSYADQAHTIELSRTADGYQARVGDTVVSFTLIELEDGRMQFVFADKVVTVVTAADGDAHWVALGGRMFELRRETRSRKSGQSSTESSEGILRAPMPGQVRAVNAVVGDEVVKGQVILVLEAMKMEIRIQSPVNGILSALPVSEGDQVDKGQVLAEVGG